MGAALQISKSKLFDSNVPVLGMRPFCQTQSCQVFLKWSADLIEPCHYTLGLIEILHCLHLSISVLSGQLLDAIQNLLK
jgi:hypothetical protein